jgi:hydroxymethylbilane synthase
LRKWQEKRYAFSEEKSLKKYPIPGVFDHYANIGYFITAISGGVPAPDDVPVKTIRIGTRGSALALAQSEWVKSALEQAHPRQPIELVVIKTTGDRILDSPLSKIGDKGLFTREIEEQLLRGDIDLAVHSMKDLPTKLPEGLAIGAITKREDPRDVFISRDGICLAGLKAGDAVATSSLRRRSQLLAMFPGLVITDIRGNLGTRIDKMQSDPALKGIILAHAGLIRLGMTGRITEVIPRDVIIPAVGQASLAVEVRQGDSDVMAMVSAVHHHESACEIQCERSFMHALEGGCQVPVAGSAVVNGKIITLTGMVASLDGKTIYRETRTADLEERERLGTGLAETLLARGARKILDEIYHGCGGREGA